MHELFNSLRVTAPNGTVLQDGDFQDVWRFNTNTHRWSHVSGPTSPKAPTHYGTQGVAGAANLPPPMHAGTIFATPFEGHIWLMGGENGSEAGGMKNGLWSFDIGGTGMWTWRTGDKRFGAHAHYGTRGHADSGNTPGARYAGQGWTTGAGLWMFGGFGIDAAATPGYLSDTWHVRC